MGTFATICTFDRQRFLDVVVPAFREGERSTIISAELAHSAALGPRYVLPSFDGLSEFMARYDDDLVHAAPDWIDPPWSIYHLWLLFERIVTRYCVDAYAYVGRRFRAIHLVPNVYPEDGREITPHEVVMDFIKRLDTRWRCWMIGYETGFTGWLDATEARAFAEVIPRITIDADDEHVPDGVEAMCAVVDHATRANLGVVWGCTLMTTDWDAYDRGRHALTRLG